MAARRHQLESVAKGAACLCVAVDRLWCDRRDRAVRATRFPDAVCCGITLHDGRRIDWAGRSGVSTTRLCHMDGARLSHRLDRIASNDARGVLPRTYAYRSCYAITRSRPDATPLGSRGKDLLVTTSRLAKT